MAIDSVRTPPMPAQRRHRRPVPRRPAPSPAAAPVNGALHTLPGLRDMIRTVEEALGARETDAVLAQLRTGLADIAARCAADLPAWLLTPDPERYRRIELHHCPVLGYQILALVWGPGQTTPIHDHAAAWGVETVWRGALEVIDFRAVEDTGERVRLEPAGAMRVGAGEAVGFAPDGGLHLCRNASTRDIAVSVHVYARALDAFHLYVDGDAAGWYRRTPCAPPLER